MVNLHYQYIDGQLNLQAYVNTLIHPENGFHECMTETDC